MKKHIVWIMLLLIGVAACDTQKSEAPPKLYTMAQFMDIVQINGGSFSPNDSKVLVSSKETGSCSLWQR